MNLLERARELLELAGRCESIGWANSRDQWLAAYEAQPVMKVRIYSESRGVYGWECKQYRIRSLFVLLGEYEALVDARRVANSLGLRLEVEDGN